MSNFTEEDFTDFYKEVTHKMEKYALDDIYNCNETALFFKQISSKSLMIKARKGVKTLKNRVTILLCTNSDGSDIRKHYIIGKSRNPTALIHFNFNLVCQYSSNKTAWITSLEFSKWLMKFDRELSLKGKIIILLLNNCRANINKNFVPEFIELVYLPKHSTFITRPLGAGIKK